MLAGHLPLSQQVNPEMPPKSTAPAPPRPRAPTGTPSTAEGGDSSTVVQLTDATLLRCIAEAPGLSVTSKRVYASAVRSLVAKAGAVTAGAAQPLVTLILQAEAAKRAISAMDVSLRTRQHYVKSVLSIFKHAACSNLSALQAVRAQWEAFCVELSAQVDALAKENRRSEREQAAWASLEEWLRVETQLAHHECGSPRHLLVSLHCRFPPLRGGDLGRVWIVPPGDPRIIDGQTNVLVWAGEDQPAEAIIQSHKTSHLKGALSRPLPPSLKRIVAASLAQHPRPTLFVSPQDGQPFTTEAVFTGWANRELRRVFGRPVTCNSARHAYCSALDVARMSTKQLEEIAVLMGHSLAQQRLYHRVDEATVAPALTNEAGEYVIPIRTGAPPTCADPDAQEVVFPHQV